MHIYLVHVHIIALNGGISTVPVSSDETQELIYYDAT